MKKASVYSTSSVLMPLTAYLLYFPAGFGPAAPSGLRSYLPLLAFNVLGTVLSVIALSLSNPKPTDTSFGMRMVMLLGIVGVFANVVAFEMVLAVVFPITPQP